MQRNRLIYTLLLISVTFPALSNADSVFTRIADSTQWYSNFSLPSVNSSGVVAFRADSNPGGGTMTGIFTGTGGAVTTDYITNLGFIRTDPAINESSQIAFDGFGTGAIGVSDHAIFRLTGGTLTQIYIDPVQIPTSTAIANNGTVFFTASGPLLGNHSTFGSGTGGPVTFYIGPNGPGIVRNVAVNSLGQGAVEHSAGTLTTTIDYIKVDGTNVLSSDTARYDGPMGLAPVVGFGDVAINAAGKIVFPANYDFTASDDLFTYANGQLYMIAHGHAQPAINDSDVIAALFDQSGTSPKEIRAGDGAPTDKVIATGDPFMGSTVTDLGMSSLSLSKGGQLAFYAKLADGRNGIYVTVVPEPSTVSLLLLGVALAGKRRRSYRSRAVVSAPPSSPCPA